MRTPSTNINYQDIIVPAVERAGLREHNIVAYGYYGSHAINLATEDSDEDVLVVISNSGSSIELLDAVSIAKENGAKVIVITRAGSPLAQFADCELALAAQEDAHRYSPMVSRSLQLAVIDILAIGLALRLGETASLQLEKGKRSILSHRVHD